MLKKILCLFMCTVMTATLVAGCKEKNENKVNKEEESSTKLGEATIFLEEMDYNYGYNPDFYFTGYDNTLYIVGREKPTQPDMMYVTDLTEGELKLNCKKESCRHNSTKCSAFICDSSSRLMGMKAVNDGVYLVYQTFLEGKIVLEKISFADNKRIDLGVIAQYEPTNELTISWLGGKNVNIKNDYLYILLNEIVNKKENKSETYKIYRYKLDGTEKSQIVYEEKRTPNGGILGGYNVYGDNLYVNTNGVNKKIDLNTLVVSECGKEDMYAYRYNKDGKILAFDISDNDGDGEVLDGIGCYLYDKNTDKKIDIKESDIKEDRIYKILASAVNMGPCYIDDKYIYLYEFEEDMGTYIFDTNFNYVGFIEAKVFATIGEYLICLKDDIIAVHRDDILKNDQPKQVLLKGTGGLMFEWNKTD